MHEMKKTATFSADIYLYSMDIVSSSGQIETYADPVTSYVTSVSCEWKNRF